MTFRQALNAVWRRRIHVLTVILLAAAAAAVFLVRQEPVYTSTITVRPNSVIAAALSGGQIGTASVDVDPTSITSRTVLGPAAASLGESAASSNSWGVTYVVGSGASPGSDATSITISASGATAAEARIRAAAVATSYNADLAQQAAAARAVAEQQATQWTAAAEAAQALVNKNPTNSIAQSNLTAAINSLSSANATISKIDSAGKPLRVTTAAAPGAFRGTSPAIAVAVALLAGLLAGIGIALIVDAFDDRLRTGDDVEALTGVPSLGELSLDKDVRRGGNRIPAAGRAQTPLNEGLRALRTTLQVLLPVGTQVVVITSVEPGDGKTFISANLALAWARGGKRVMLIGGDLRKAGLEQYFDEVTGRPGLTELLKASVATGKAPSRESIAEHVIATEFAGLSILPTGAEPWDPADLLAVDGLGEIIASLRTTYDVVVIDSPPALALVDASLLAAHADGAVVVAAVRRTQRRLLGETINALTANGISVLGVVANRSRQLLPKSYSSYYNNGGRRRMATRAEDNEPEEIAEHDQGSRPADGVESDSFEAATTDDSVDQTSDSDSDSEDPRSSFTNGEDTQPGDPAPAADEQPASASTPPPSSRRGRRNRASRTPRPPVATEDEKV